jgi:hypothetical protein
VVGVFEVSAEGFEVGALEFVEIGGKLVHFGALADVGALGGEPVGEFLDRPA